MVDAQSKRLIPQDDWYDGVKTLKSAGLAGKTVALFGCGDSESYPDTFCSREVYFSKASAKVLTIFHSTKYFEEKVCILTVF